MRIELVPLDAVMLRYGEQLKALGQDGKTIMANSLNKGGRDGTVEIKRALRVQTGLKLSAVTKALKQTRASSRTLTWKLTATGGPVPLKYFKPREVKGGVKHTSPMDPNPYPGGFLKTGGWVYNAKKRDVSFRMAARKKTGRFGGHVMENVEGGKWGGKVKVVLSSVSIPKAIVEKESRAAFERIGPRVVEEVGRLLAGYLNGTISIKSRAKG